MRRLLYKMLKNNLTKGTLSALLIGFALLTQVDAQDVWQPANGPYGGSVNGLTTAPDGTIYAGVQYGGVFKSIDKGATWTPTGLGGSVFSLLAATNQMLFAGGHSSSLYRTTDYGVTWEIKNTGLPGSSVKSMVYSSTLGYLWAATSEGIYRTSNLGENWTPVNNNLTELNVNILLLTNSNVIYAGTINGGLFRSTTSGDSWEQLSNGLPVTTVNALTQDTHGNIFAGLGSNYGVYRSANGGDSWTQINVGLTDRSVYSLAANSGNNLYVGTWGSGLFTSADSGDTWQQANLGFSPLIIKTLMVDPHNDDIYAGSMWYYGGGIYYSSTNGLSWVRRNEGLNGSRIWKTAYNPFTGSVFAGDYYNGVYRSKDHGQNWAAIGNGMDELQSSFIRGLAMHPSGTIFSASSGRGVHRSRDDGNSWTRVYGAAGVYVFVSALAVRQDGVVFIGEDDADGGFYRSDSEGDSWEDITGDLQDKNANCIAFNKSGDIYVGTKRDGIYKTSDEGVTWSQVGSTFSTNEIYSIAINSKGHVYVTVTGQGVFRTTDDNTWTQLGATVLGTTNHPIIINKLDHIFTGLSDLWVSKNEGNTWANYDKGLNSYEINDLVFDAEEALYAGTMDGVYKTYKSTTAVDIKFSVKMKYEDGFDPSSQGVVVSGPFNNWGGDGDWDLIAENDADLTYSGSFSVSDPLAFFKNDSLRYLFAIKSAANERLPDSRVAVWDGSNVVNLAPVWFSNQLEFTRMTTNGLTGETTGSRAIAWGDFNNDGNDDMIITETGTSSRNDIYLNNSNGGFDKLTSGPVGLDNGDSRAAAWGDYNNDGYLDLFVANLGQANFLYKNDGSGNFNAVSDPAISADIGNSVGAVWLDIDNDGWLDLFVANSGAGDNYLYKNNGDESFTKITGQAVVSDGGDSRGCAAADFNNDGFPDLFVANAGSGGEYNFLYLNNRSGGFVKRTAGPVAEDQDESSGGSWGDYNNDGWLDLYVTNHGGELNRLYKNDGSGNFIAVSGSQVPTLPGFHSMGSAWADYDNDGWLDLYVTTLDLEQNLFFRNKGDGSFEQQLLGPLVQESDKNSRGAAWADYDNDGDLDLAVANDDQANSLFRNNLLPSNWFKIKLEGSVSNRAAIGATVILKTKLSKEDGTELIQRRNVEGQSGFLGQNSQTLFFGLRQETNVDSIIIYWPSGIINKHDSKPANQTMPFTEFDPLITPPKVILNAPADQSSNISLPPGLAWNEASGATHYQLQVATDISFSTPLIDENTITNTVFTIPDAAYNQTYYWQVRAGNESQWGPWSDIWKFTTISSTGTLPSAPSLNTPSNGATNIKIQPTLSWNAVSGATKYWFQVSESNTFDSFMAQDSNTSFTSYTTGGGSYNTLYYWRVCAKNDAGWGAWSAIWNFTTEPLTGLPDAPTLIGPVNGQTAVPVPAPLVWNSAASGSYTVEIATDISFSNIVFSRSDNPERYLFTNGLNCNQQYYWHVRVSVTGINSDWSSAWSFTTYSDKVEVNSVTVPFPFHERKDEFSASDYRMVGLPGNANIAFIDILGDGEKENWMAYWDNGKTGNPGDYFVPFDGSGVFRFITGRGFWIIHNGSITINQSIPIAPLNELAQTEIDVHQGWNIITCPFGHSINWSAVKLVNDITIVNPIFRYNSSTRGFETSDKLDPLQGYYFYNGDAARSNLLVPYIDGVGKALVQSDLSWEVALEISSGQTIDASAKIGVAADAETGLDRYEYRKPRSFADLASVYFDRSEWDANYAIFANDIRPEIDGMETWEFKVYAPENEESKFALIGLESIPENYEVYLIDKTHQRYQNLRENGIYDFNSTPKISDFELLIGESDAVEDKIQSILPAAFALGQNYPNPFNPTTTIPLTLPEQSDLTLKVYNVLGQEIVTIFKGNLMPGKHYFSWDGTNKAKQAMPSGVYMVQMTATNGQRFTGKMILIK